MSNQIVAKIPNNKIPDTNFRQKKTNKIKLLKYLIFDYRYIVKRLLTLTIF